MLRGVGGLTLASALPGTAEGDVLKSKRPNIVFLISDQHAYKYCGFMGHPFVRTPNLDRIARRGTVFSNAYCGSPVCTPSRAGMLSGVYPSDCNSFCNATVWDGSLPTWPQLLRDAGYRTFGAGKVDTRNDFDLGFDQSYQVSNQHEDDPDITALFRRPLCFRPGERDVIDGRARAARHKDEGLAGAAVEFIQQQARGTQPWAAYCGLYLPHPAFAGLKDQYEYYLSRVDLPNIPPGHLEAQHDVFTQLRHFKNLGTPVSEEKVRRARAAYYAMITEMDEYVGRLWSALEETGQLENTLFVYTSDHGESLGEHGLWLKNNLYDVGARIPLVMAGPGVPSGKTVDTAVAHVDLIRTLLEVGRARASEKLRGHSLMPLINGQSSQHPGWAYSESHSEGNCTGSFMIRKGDWKYLHFTWYDGLLFNLADDPGEFRNRFNDPTARDALHELRGILLNHVDPVEITERAFRTQRQRLDRLAEGRTPDSMLDVLRGRLGEGQAVSLLVGYYGRSFSYTSKPKSADPSGV